MNPSPPSLIAPHGGRLTERLVDRRDEPRLLDEARALPQVPIDARTLSDIRLLGVGALSPLEGFMTRTRYTHVVRDMRLEDGLPWTIPITLAIDPVEHAHATRAEAIALAYRGSIVATLRVTDAYRPDKAHEAVQVYGVDDPAHPGVKTVYEQGELYLGGPVDVFRTAYVGAELAEYQYTPRQTREEFLRRQWKSVVAFQTRNPIHRAHEYLQKCALEMVDGLLVHPLVGQTKDDDLDALTRFKCYERLLGSYYPKDRVLLAAFPASMRYAGPREAVFHALCRKNYGCTHFIVGRDHAGVGNYYGTYDAQRIFDRFTPEEIGIVPLKFEHAFYCTVCGGMTSGKTCPHPAEAHVILSGTKVREMVRAGVAPPPEFTRPEVAEILIERAAADNAVVLAQAGGGRNDP